MAEAKHTKLRYIIADDRDQLVAAIEALGFKIEIKNIIDQGGPVICYFTIEDHRKFTSKDLS